MKNKLVESFFTTLNERNGLSIAANDNYADNDAKQRLIHKYNIKDFKVAEYGANVDDSNMTVYQIDGNFYGINKDKTVYTLTPAEEHYSEPLMIGHWERVGKDDAEYVEDFDPDGRMVGRVRTIYHIESVLDSKDTIAEFIKAYSLIGGRDWDKAKAKKAADKTEYEKAKKVFHVTVLNGKYNSAEDYYENCDDEDQEFEDDEAEFEIDVKMGSKPILSGTAAVSLYYKGNCIVTHSYPGSYWEPAESEGYKEIEYEGIGDDIILFDQNGEDISLVDTAENIPGMFSTLFDNHIEHLIKDAIDAYIPKNEKYYKDEW